MAKIRPFMEVRPEDINGWFILSLNDEGNWNVDGPFDPHEAYQKYNSLKRVMPKCPHKVVKLNEYSSYPNELDLLKEEVANES